ncbi:YeeE/YedE family protein [Breoghania sp. L-A4]|uniref:YeeE/YedE family protein n=1 Tax=Breoghania sp. L-A4 TaxID=2304600 RepID=UPI000E35D9B8|nr:YeeE/YedE family protein [Breoghania sp. L-A4]AXS41965.1 YeeE/YedE family protein [Breoghania sp. L-A4]
MDLTGFIDWLGEGGTAAFGGLLIGMAFGICAQRSRFCLRAAVIEFARGSIGVKTSVWLLTFGGAVAATQGLIETGWLDVSEARQLAARSSLSGAAIGGALFGTGMILARGCASRLLVLSANGNLRALLSGLIFAVTAQASLRGILSPLRNELAALWAIDGGETADLLAILGTGAGSGLVFGLLFLAAAVAFAIRARLPLGRSVAAFCVGLTVAAGWFFTYSLASQAFDPIPLQSMTFTGPSADALMLFLSPPGGAFDFSIGLVPGVFLGSFLAASSARELKLEGFRDGQSMRRYIIGAVLMGFGGMLAGGCAVGAGVTGGSIFAITAWVTLTTIWASAALTDWLMDRKAELAQEQEDSVTPAPESALTLVR